MPHIAAFVIAALVLGAVLCGAIAALRDLMRGGKRGATSPGTRKDRP